MLIESNGRFFMSEILGYCEYRGYEGVLVSAEIGTNKRRFYFVTNNGKVLNTDLSYSVSI